MLRVWLPVMRQPVLTKLGPKLAEFWLSLKALEAGNQAYQIVWAQRLIQTKARP